MHDITTRAPRRRRWLRDWWIWPVAMVTLGWALALAAYAWMHDDAQSSRTARHPFDLDGLPSGGRAAFPQPFPMHGRVLVEHGLVQRAVTRTSGAVDVTHWLFPVVAADWREGQARLPQRRSAGGPAPHESSGHQDAVTHVLRVAEGAPLRALSQAPDGPWLVMPRGTTTRALVEALRDKGLQVDASTALVQWHSASIEP